jgi:DNA-binding response OmpR family regulator
VKQYIYHLRNKIERDPQSPQLIQNVKGFGYKLCS